MGTGGVWDVRGEGRQSRNGSRVVDRSLELGIWALAWLAHSVFYITLIFNKERCGAPAPGLWGPAA